MPSCPSPCSTTLITNSSASRTAASPSPVSGPTGHCYASAGGWTRSSSRPLNDRRPRLDDSGEHEKGQRNRWLVRSLASPTSESRWPVPRRYAVDLIQQSALCQATLSIGPYLLLEGACRR